MQSVFIEKGVVTTQDTITPSVRSPYHEWGGRHLAVLFEESAIVALDPQVQQVGLVLPRRRVGPNVEKGRNELMGDGH